MIDVVLNKKYHSKIYKGSELQWSRPVAPNLYKDTDDFKFPTWHKGYGNKTQPAYVEPFELDPAYNQARITKNSDSNGVATDTDSQGFTFCDPNITFVISAWFKAEEADETIGITIDGSHIGYLQQELPHNEWIRLRWVFKGFGNHLITFRFQNDSLKGIVWVAKVKVESMYPYATDYVSKENSSETI